MKWAWSIAGIVVAAVVAFGAYRYPDLPFIPKKPPVKLVLLTHWEDKPEFTQWYAEKARQFAKGSGSTVEVVTIPYPGYDAKYLEMLRASGGPDIFMGITHQWCGQYDLCDKMPSDLAATLDRKLPPSIKAFGEWKGVRYGIPIENGSFEQMYINVDMFKAAGLNPDDPPKTMNDWLAALQKLTTTGPDGSRQSGFLIRTNAHPTGLTTDFLPFAHAFGARMLSPQVDKATGYANSPEMTAALTFFSDLALKQKVANVDLDNPLQGFAKNRVAVVFFQSWYSDWLKKNAPDVKYKVYAVPCEKTCPGPDVLFPWTDLVNKNSPNKKQAWDFLRDISNAADDLEHHQRQGLLPMWAENIETEYVKARPDYRSVKDMLSRQPSPNYAHPKLEDLARTFGEAVMSAVLGQGAPQALLDDAAAKMDRILKE